MLKSILACLGCFVIAISAIVLPSRFMSVADAGREILIARKLSSDQRLGLWVWQNNVVFDTGARKKLLDTVQASHFTEIYLEAVKLTSESPLEVRSLIQDFTLANVRVDLLMAQKGWEKPEYQPDAIAMIDRSIQFIKTLPEEARGAIHLDIEPHGDSVSELASFRELVYLVSAHAHANGVQVRVDVPNWLDDEFFNYILGAADGVVVMDYRDSVLAMVSKVESELNIAEKAGKQIVIGLETSCDAQEVGVSFCSKGKGAWRAALTELSLRLGNQSGFGGLAVHDYAAISRFTSPGGSN